jgi:hypothetical protein
MAHKMARNQPPSAHPAPLGQILALAEPQHQPSLPALDVQDLPSGFLPPCNPRLVPQVAVISWAGGAVERARTGASAGGQCLSQISLKPPWAQRSAWPWH